MGFLDDVKEACATFDEESKQEIMQAAEEINRQEDEGGEGEQV